MRIPFFLLTIACVALAATEEEAIKEFKTGNRNFSADLYTEITKVKTRNIAISPFSATTIMALTREGARGDSSSEIVKGLLLPDTNEKIQQAIKPLLAELKSSADTKLWKANKIYLDKHIKLENTFNQDAKEVYDTGVEDIDFAENYAAAKKINGWVEDRTEGKISDLLDPYTINGETKILLVNTLYFKGRWTYVFPERSTTKKKFHTSKDTSVDVDMMSLNQYLRYYENSDLNAKFLELTYRGGEMSMVFVLPNQIEGLSALEGNMRDVLAAQPFTDERVEVEIPKFKIVTDIKLIPILQKLGIKKIFDKTTADLAGISSTTQRLSISGVVQKVLVGVDENGTEAAAGTEEAEIQHTPIVARAGPQKYFVANHPFLYYVQRKGVILFVGRFTE